MGSEPLIQKTPSPELDSLDELSRAPEEYRTFAPISRASFERWWTGLTPSVRRTADWLAAVIEKIQTGDETIGAAPCSDSFGGDSNDLLWRTQ